MVCLSGPVFIDKAVNLCKCVVLSNLMAEAAHPFIHSIYLATIYLLSARCIPDILVGPGIQ